MASKESTKVPTVDEFEEQIFNAEIKLLEENSLIKESNVLDPKSDALLYIDSVSELKDPALLDIKKSITKRYGYI